MVELAHPSLREYLLRFKYFTIDIGSFSKRSLVKLKNNLVSAIFLLENARNENELEDVLEEIIGIVKSEMDANLVATFGDWFEMLMKRATNTEIKIKEIISQGSEHTMLVETLQEIQKKWVDKGWKNGLQEGMQKGMQKGKRDGIQEGITKTAMRLLKEGFDVNLIARVTGLSVKEIEKLKKDLG